MMYGEKAENLIFLLKKIFPTFGILLFLPCIRKSFPGFLDFCTGILPFTPTKYSACLSMLLKYKIIPLISIKQNARRKNSWHFMSSPLRSSIFYLSLPVLYTQRTARSIWLLLWPFPVPSALQWRFPAPVRSPCC